MMKFPNTWEFSLMIESSKDEPVTTIEKPWRPTQKSENLFRNMPSLWRGLFLGYHVVCKAGIKIS
jgi:hypothetical protein